ncbi:MAG TPA: hypothetical protein VGO83_05570 [Thermoleophilaceae bacterium]|nr:hypothetical protein [Thermoleophilaceae bacterium]
MRGRDMTKTIAIAAVCAAVGTAGGIAGVSAATGDNAAGSSTTAGADQRPGPPDGGPGRHVGANGVREQALSADVADKVRAAALAKVDGGTVERVETDADHGSPYEAHVRRADGTELEVLVNKSFSVTAVNEMQHP